MSYDDLLERKRERAKPTGFDVALADLNPNLYDYQAATVKWMLYERLGLPGTEGKGPITALEGKSK